MRWWERLRRRLRPPEPQWIGPPYELRCSYCDGTEFYEGPHGGLSVNVMCVNKDCEHWFNYHRGIFPADDLHQVGRERRFTE